MASRASGALTPFSRRNRKKRLAKLSSSSLTGGINDPDALERNIQPLRDGLYFCRVTEHDGSAQSQRIKLPGRLQDARFLALGKHHPFGMALQFFNDVAYETHGHRLTAKPETAK
jgi:hypothetical protein